MHTCTCLRANVHSWAHAFTRVHRPPHVRIHGCTVHTLTRVRTHMRANTCAHSWVYTHTHTHTCMHTYTFLMHAHPWVYTCTGPHVCTFMGVQCTHTRVHTHMRAHTCIYIHGCTHTPTCTHTHSSHMHIRGCTHAHTHRCVHTRMSTHVCTHPHMYTRAPTHVHSHRCTVARTRTVSGARRALSRRATIGGNNQRQVLWDTGWRRTSQGLSSPRRACALWPGHGLGSYIKHESSRFGWGTDPHTKQDPTAKPAKIISLKKKNYIQPEGRYQLTLSCYLLGRSR